MLTQKARTAVAVLVIILIGVSTGAAQDPAGGQTQLSTSTGDEPHWTTWALHNRSYFDPAIAEDHAPDVNITVLANGSQLQYSQVPGRRRLWTISLGKEVPVFGRETVLKPKSGVPVTCFSESGYPPAGCSGWGIWFAVDFHMMEDFRDPSNPIVDTDYRFGGIAKYQHVFAGATPEKLAARPATSCKGTNSPLQDTKALGLRGYFGHESTHLGDEFSLAAQRTKDVSDFQRINVSYQYWEYGLSYDIVHQCDSGDTNVFRFRHLGSILDPLTGSWRDGYYSTDPLEVNGHVVTPSTNKYEPAFEFEWLNESLGLGSQLNAAPGTTQDIPWHRWWRPFVSVDARYRTVYNYAKSDPTAAEARQWSTNVVAGFRRPRQLAERGIPDFFVRGYYGVNPYGQLRNQRDFFLIGVGLHIFV